MPRRPIVARHGTPKRDGAHGPQSGGRLVGRARSVAGSVCDAMRRPARARQDPSRSRVRAFGLGRGAPGSVWSADSLSETQPGGRGRPRHDPGHAPDEGALGRGSGAGARVPARAAECACSRGGGRLRRRRPCRLDGRDPLSGARGLRDRSGRRSTQPPGNDRSSGRPGARSFHTSREAVRSGAGNREASVAYRTGGRRSVRGAALGGAPEPRAASGSRQDPARGTAPIRGAVRARWSALAPAPDWILR